MWNLIPTTKEINSAKSNKLPDWDYFKELVKQEYEKSYKLIWKYDKVHEEFDKCVKYHINSDDIRYRLYREGLTPIEFSGELESIIKPVYNSAMNCGFGNWKYSEKDEKEA